MPDLFLYYESGRWGVAQELELVLPEVVHEHMTAMSDATFELDHVNFWSFESRTPRTGGRYGDAFNLHIHTRMAMFAPSDDKDSPAKQLGVRVRTDPRVREILERAGEHLLVRPTYVAATWVTEDR